MTAASLVTETEITALALPTAGALNATCVSLSQLNGEVYQLRKVAWFQIYLLHPEVECLP